MSENQNMNRAKFYQLAMFPMNNGATNVYYVLILSFIATFGNRVLGPERPTIGRIANRYIQTIMLKVEAGASMAKVKTILRNLYVRLAADPRMKQTTLYYDVDPA